MKLTNLQQNNTGLTYFGSIRLPVRDGIPKQTLLKIQKALPRFEENGDLYELSKTEEGSMVNVYLGGMLQGRYGDKFEKAGILAGSTLNDIMNPFHIIPCEYNSKLEKKIVRFLKPILGQNAVTTVDEQQAIRDVEVYNIAADLYQVFPHKFNPNMN